MQTYISLLRGINVSGQKKVPMAVLKELYISLGLTSVQTYIQSGNVIFQSDETNPRVLQKQLEKAIRQSFGFDVIVMLRTPDVLQSVLEHPFLREREDMSKALYVTFLAEQPEPEREEAFTSPNSDGDEFQMVNKEVYVFCPNGYGKTKLSNTFFERKLKVSATTRNTKTVRKLLDIAINLT